MSSSNIDLKNTIKGTRNLKKVISNINARRISNPLMMMISEIEINLILKRKLGHLHLKPSTNHEREDTHLNKSIGTLVLMNESRITKNTSQITLHKKKGIGIRSNTQSQDTPKKIIKGELATTTNKG